MRDEESFTGEGGGGNVTFESLPLLFILSLRIFIYVIIILLQHKKLLPYYLLLSTLLINLILPIFHT